MYSQVQISTSMGKSNNSMERRGENVMETIIAEFDIMAELMLYTSAEVG